MIIVETTSKKTKAYVRFMIGVAVNNLMFDGYFSSVWWPTYFGVTVKESLDFLLKRVEYAF